jgi:type II secretory pathway pseudopilin PulG
MQARRSEVLQMKANTMRVPGGFSLIEVLVSVVVMSFGLLSLAALQGTLFKASAETRAQSVALALAAEKIEYFDGYRDRTEFQSFADGNDAAVTVDGIAYTRSWTVERYAYPEAGGSFALVADAGPTPDGYVTNNEFKRIQVKVVWDDASGVEQSVALESALSALSPQDTAKVAKVSSTGGARGPEVIIVDPSTEEGVIPIAVGDGSDTAATNPKPEVAGKSNSQRVIETRFDVLTYAALSGGNALAQSRVETVVAGCTCDYGNKPSSTVRGKRPTYWNGLRYVVPDDADYAPPAGIATAVQNQSPLCTACCRDHHDPAAVKGARFDPRRAVHTAHQLYDAKTGQLGDLAATGQYTEACRLIRVDGFFRVASDMYDDYMNLLQTDNGADDTISDYVPTKAATQNYQAFVLDYLRDKFVSGTSGTYNTVLDPEGSGVQALEAQHDLNAPTTAIPIPRPSTQSGTSTLKWLHDRGLYIDYLEDEAVQAVNDAKTECRAADGTAPSATDLRTCVLKVLPFTTINLTELADWTPVVGEQIVVSNNDFRTSLDSDVPVRGKVVPGAHPTPNTPTDAVAIMRVSNSGVAVMPGPIDTGDAVTHDDAQPFIPDGSWSGADNDAGSGGTFAIRLDSYVFTNVKPTFSVVPTATCNPAVSGTTMPNPFTCTSQYVGDAQVVTVANYNYQIVSTSTAPLACSGNNGNKAYPGASYTTKTCRNYAVTGWSINDAAQTGTASVANAGSTSERSTISLPAINQGDVIGISFGQPVDTVQAPVCTYNGNGSKQNQFHVETPDCP